MKRLQWLVTMATWAALASTARAEDRTIYKADTPTWIGARGPALTAPAFSSTARLPDQTFLSQYDIMPEKGNGNGNGDGNGNGNGERSHLKDNSFFIEEAYNQEPGVVQHIFNWIGLWEHDFGRNREAHILYTMELPIGSVLHQFSFAIPNDCFSLQPDGEPKVEEGGLGDVFLNYRYQLLEEDDLLPAVAPRFSLILPTGDEDRGLGNGELGYQFNLPVSKEVEPFAFHFNAGFTYIPDVSVELAPGVRSVGQDLRGYNLGASAIWLVNYDLNFFVEFVAFFNEELDEAGARDHVTTLLINPAVRYALYTEGDLQWVIGLGFPIGLNRESPDWGVFGYMSVEHRFLKE